MFRLVAAILLLAGAFCSQAQDLTSMNWEQIVEQAKKEGKLTWYQWYYQDRLKEQVSLFEKQYGINVTLSEGTLQGNINKLMADRGRETGDIDVFSIGGGAFGTVSPQQTFFGPLNTLLPEGKTLNYTIEGTDSQGYGVAFWGNQTGLAYDLRRLKESELPRTLPQITSFLQSHPQEFGFNVENGGSGPAFIESVTRTLVPGFDFTKGDADVKSLTALQPAWNWFKQQRPNYIITASNADSVTRLVSGEFLLVPAWEDYLVGLENHGEVPKTIRLYIPDFGMPGGGNMVAIPKNAPHKAAALLFIHWLTLPTTQRLFQQVYGITPQNKEVNRDAGLINSKERVHGTQFMPKPLGDEVRTEFSNQVLLK
ncbi:extracellular solute-binding protein [Pantoea ananatis]|uniref:extracellular solute-binding protein n=1 Tax=Pantoea ananas TaxID=553 RepID=UPI0021E74E1D|nr:extracellular solute-binding protein [Pantoea ananatis]MCV3300526.1 extracellular solute-binding protein [Pantoea ananatis]